MPRTEEFEPRLIAKIYACRPAAPLDPRDIQATIDREVEDRIRALDVAIQYEREDGEAYDIAAAALRRARLRRWSKAALAEAEEEEESRARSLSMAIDARNRAAWNVADTREPSWRAALAAILLDEIDSRVSRKVAKKASENNEEE